MTPRSRLSSRAALWGREGIRPSSAPLDTPHDTGSSPARDPEELHREVFDLVCRHMKRLAGGRDADYEDLVQLAAERAFRSLPSFEGRSSLSTWTFQVCYRTLLNERRWYRRWLRRFTLTHEGELPDRPSLREDTPDALEWRERHLRLRGAVDRLSPKLRVVLTLHDFDGLALEEIGELLELNPLTVRSRLREGRKRLKEKLRRDPYFGDEACQERGLP